MVVRFFARFNIQLEAVKKAEQQFASTGKTSFTFDMGKIVGEGYLKEGGAGSYRLSSNIQAVFKDGKLLTLYPLLR